MFRGHQRCDSYDKNGGFAADSGEETVECDLVVVEGMKLGLHISDANVVIKLDLGSPCARKLRVGDLVVSVNGQEASGSAVLASDIISSTGFGEQLTIIAMRLPGPTKGGFRARALTQ